MITRYGSSRLSRGAYDASCRVSARHGRCWDRSEFGSLLWLRNGFMRGGLRQISFDHARLIVNPSGPLNRTEDRRLFRR